jgi:hypothetical protein
METAATEEALRGGAGETEGPSRVSLGLDVDGSTMATSTKRTRRPRHGLNTLKRAVNKLGPRAIDRRTALGKSLAQWRHQLATDLGGVGAISTQQAAIIDLAVRTKLLLDSIDAWLLTRPSLIDKKRRALLPVVRERQQLADALARYLSQLGLERRAAPAMDLQTYLTAEYGVGAQPGTATTADGDEEGT